MAENKRILGDLHKDYPADLGVPKGEDISCANMFKIGDKWMLLGLANDEIGYIIPRCQWDRQRPFAYGRMTGQYGEINSCGPDVAPIVMQAVLDSVNSLKGKR